LSSSSKQNPLAYLFEPAPFVEIFSIAWKARWAIFVGTFLGLMGGLLYVTHRPPLFTTTVSVSLRSQSLPASESSEAVLARYTAALRMAVPAQAGFSVLLEQAPELRANLFLTWNTHPVLLRTQTAIQNAAGASRLPLSLQRGASSPAGVGEKSQDYLITAKLPARGLGSNAATALTNALNTVGAAYNAIEIEKHNARNHTQPTPFPTYLLAPQFEPNPHPIWEMEEPRGNTSPILGCTVLGAVLAFYTYAAILFLRTRLRSRF
jgi:hypothetical protein